MYSIALAESKDFNCMLPVIKRKICLGLLVAVFFLAASFASAEKFNSFYGEAVYSGEFGASSYAKYMMGNRQGDNDQYLFASMESSDTSGSNQLYSYGNSGLKVGAGMRHWLPGKQMFVSAEVYQTLFGDNAGDLDVKVGGAGFWGSTKGNMFNETYAELFYTDSSEVVSFNAIHRMGRSSKLMDSTNSIDIYGLAQLSYGSAGAPGSNGDGNNRIELGAGIRYKVGMNIAASAELRGGTYMNEIAGRSNGFVNPVVMVTAMY